MFVSFPICVVCICCISFVSTCVLWIATSGLMSQDKLNKYLEDVSEFYMTYKYLYVKVN